MQAVACGSLISDYSTKHSGHHADHLPIKRMLQRPAGRADRTRHHGTLKGYRCQEFIGGPRRNRRNGYGSDPGVIGRSGFQKSTFVFIGQKGWTSHGMSHAGRSQHESQRRGSSEAKRAGICTAASPHNS